MGQEVLIFFRHMHEEHEIEITDEVTFFKLHDLDDDGFWDESDIRAMYGFEEASDTGSDHAKVIIKRVIKGMDVDEDGRVSLEEYIKHKLPLLTKREEEARQESKKNKKKNAKSGNKDQDAVIPKTKKSPSKRKEALKGEGKIFNQQGDDAFIPLKFRA